MVTEYIYLIWCHERGMWWKRNGNGYTHRSSEAGKFNLSEAIDICMDANINSDNRVEESMVPFVKVQKVKTVEKSFL